MVKRLTSIHQDEADLPRPTLRQIAERCGTSVATVSYVLNDKAGHLRPSVRDEVSAVARELGYVRNAVARSLKGMPRGVIAVLVPQFGNNFFTRICVEVEAVARDAGYVVSICNSDEDPAQERSIVERLISQQVDGCIVSPALSQGANIALLARHGVPTIILERSLGTVVPERDFVGHDNHQAGHLAASCLLDLGHRRIGLAGWDSPIPNIHDRAHGFAAALHERGVPDPGSWVMLDALGEQGGRRMARCLLERGITGLVIAHHHELARGVLLELLDRGLRWPQDLSVVLIGTPEWHDLVRPGLTCVARPEREMGRLAASLLLAKVAAPRQASPALLASTLLPAGSTGPVPTGGCAAFSTRGCAA